VDVVPNLPVHPTAAEQARMSAAIMRVAVRYHERFMAGEPGIPDLAPLDRAAETAVEFETAYWDAVKNELATEFGC
jgi:hypothetical protein